MQSLGNHLLRQRMDLGLSQTDLAQKVGMSLSGYRKLERGQAEPRPDTLKALAGALRVPLRELLTPAPSLHGVRFRSLRKLKSRSQILADVGRWLRDYAALEQITGECPARNLQPLLDAMGQESGSDIPRLAEIARRHFGLSEREPVHDICGLLEAKDIKVYSVDVANGAFMGLSVAKGDGGPAIIVNTWARLPVETWIFSAAHEMGHLLLHLSAYEVDQEHEDTHQEREANEFASHFLMPEPIFLKEWEDTAGLALVDRVLKVKRVFRVSWRTVLFRVAQRMPAERRQCLWQRFNLDYQARNGRSLLKHDEPIGASRDHYDGDYGRPMGKEPESMERHDFQSDRLYRLVRRAVEEELISLSRAAEILRLPLVEMRELSASWVV